MLFHPILALAISQYSDSFSMPIKSIPNSLQATPVEPLPMKGSRQIGLPGGANKVIMYFIKEIGFTVG